MTLISLYLNRLLLTRFLLISGLLLFFALSFDLLEAADAIAGTETFDFPLITYMLLRLPGLLSKLLPIFALLAALAVFVELLRHREIVIFWDAGLSPRLQMQKLLPVALLLCGLQFLIDDRLMPPSTESLRDWGVAEFSKPPSLADQSGYIWVTSGTYLMRFRLSEDRQGLDAPLIFVRDDRGLLTEEIRADYGQLTAEGWRLVKVKRYEPASDHLTYQESMPWPGDLDLARLRALALPASELSFSALSALSKADGYGIKPGYIYETWQHYRLARGLSPLLLIFLVAAMAQRFRRRAPVITLLAGAILIGFFFEIFGSSVVSLGEAGLLPPLLAAWIPSAALTLTIFAFALRPE